MSAIALFGKMLSFSRLRLMTDDLAQIKAELETLVGGKTPIPVVVDGDVELDLKALVDMLWELGVQPIGVVEGALTKQAGELRLATFPSDGKRIERLKPIDNVKIDNAKADKKPALDVVSDVTETVNDTPSEPTSSTDIVDTFTQLDELANADKLDAEKSDKSDSLFNVDIINDVSELSSPANTPAFVDTDNLIQAVPTSTEVGSFSQEVFDEKGMTSSVHNHMLRSGQSVQHLGGDLVIIGGVNNGAEAITDNNLHIYGHGQGRLVAGATGDKDARIFCQKFNPSLVSVAGTYCLREAIPAEMIDKAVQVSYDSDKGLIFTLMTN